MLFSSDGNHDAAMWNDVQSFGNGAQFDATVMDDHGHVFKITTDDTNGAPFIALRRLLAMELVLLRATTCSTPRSRVHLTGRSR